MEEKKFKIEIKEVKGSCDSEIFRKMVSKGDVTSTKIQKVVGTTVKITGYALCHITTDKKDFDMGYYATDKGIISTGSTVFAESVKDYIDVVDRFNIVEVETRNGKTYKVSPELVSNIEETE